MALKAYLQERGGAHTAKRSFVMNALFILKGLLTSLSSSHNKIRQSKYCSQEMF